VAAPINPSDLNFLLVKESYIQYPCTWGNEGSGYVRPSPPLPTPARRLAVPSVLSELGGTRVIPWTPVQLPPSAARGPITRRTF
jgi:hypothetical protein